MIRIGLTGMSGSGKSFVSEIFKQYGISSVNSDKLVHELYSAKNPCTEKLALLFGADVLREDHSIDRQRLGGIVFSSADKLSLLNRTVHPFVVQKIEALAKEKEKEGAAAFLIEAPQLFEAGLESSCDYVVSVLSDHNTRVKRLIARDGISPDMAEKRLKNQHNDSFFRERSDYIIENFGDCDLQKQIVAILKEMGLLS